MNNSTQYYNRVIEKLRKVYNRGNLFLALENFIRGVLYSGLLVLLLTILEYTFGFGSEVRTVLFFLSSLASVYFLFGKTFYFLLKCISPFNTQKIYLIASKVGEHYPAIKDDLKNSLQLLDEKNKNYSTELIDAAFKSVCQKSERYDFTEIIQSKSIYRFLFQSGVSLSIIGIVFLTFTGFNDSFKRIINYDQEFSIPPRITFEVIPGNKEIAKGEELIISVKVSGDYNSSVNLYYKYSDQSAFVSKRITETEDDFYKYRFSSLNSPLEYYIECEGLESDKFEITVLNRPIVKSLKLVITFPGYSRLEKSIQLDNGSLNVLKGSKVELEIESSENLSRAFLDFSDSVMEMNIDDKDSRVNFTVVKNDKYSIQLIDERGIESINPVEYEINIIPDLYPELELLAPEDQHRIASDVVALKSKIRDDFGFEKYILNYRLSASRYESTSENFSTVNIPVNQNMIEQEIYFNWNVSDLFLAEGDVVSYYLEIFDNDIVSGPKSTKSSVRTIIIPSMDEFFDEADKVQDTAKEELTKTLEEAKQLQDEMEQLSNELKRDEREISYEEKKKIEETLNKYEQLSEKASDVADKLKDMQNDLMENNLLSNETMQKYMELQDLMKELQGNELLDAIRKMQNELEKLLRNQAQKNLDDIKMNENTFRESIERTLNLLKRLQVEQKVDEMIKRAEKLEEKIKKAAEKTLENPEDKNGIEKRQEDINNDLSNFQKAMEDLAEKMSELPNMPEKQMEKIQEKYTEQNNEELGEKIKQDLKNQKSQSMQKMLKQMSQNMNEMGDMFSEMQQQMNREMQMEMFYDMAKIINDLIHVSKDQEKLKDETEQYPGDLEMLNKLTDKQNKLSENLEKVINKVSALSQKSFAVTPELGNSLGRARIDMQQSKNYLQGGSSGSALMKEKSAMKNVNEAASLMKGAMNQMMNSSGQSGGMMSLMQQLKQMSQQQMSLNQMTQMLKQQQLAQQQMESMQRLAEEQEMIRKSLAELNREARESGQSQKLAGDLEKILQEMQEAVKDMQSQNPDNNLLQKQERILSRLLDAQKSINERDFEEKRESFSGRDISGSTPASLDFNQMSESDMIKEELKKALQEGYKKDYEELIRKYFEAIKKELKN